VRKFMKLFKSLLVAPATLGLLAPMSATANELNIAEVSGYSSSEEVQSISDFYPKELAITNSRVDGLEARMNDFEAGGFSETTTASFSADMYVGSVDGGTSTSDDAVMAGYSFDIDLNTSFTGEDSLDVEIDAGNASGAGVVEFDGNTGGDTLKVDSIAYTFPIGDSVTVMVGDGADGSSLFTTACVYGGPSNTLDDCGNVNANIENGGAMIGTAYDFGNGFTVAAGYAGPESAIATLESADAYGFNAAYTADNYGVSVTYGITDNAMFTDTVDNNGFTADKYTALNAYYTGDNLPSISVGYEFGDIGGATDATDEQSSFFVGVSGEVGPGTAGVALGYSNIVENADEEYMYEAYYSYPINDGMTVTPLVFVKEKAATGVDDETGVMVKTSFSF